MADVIEQRMVVKFCYRLGNTAAESHQMMKQAYGDGALSESETFLWYNRFQEGWTTFEEEDELLIRTSHTKNRKRIAKNRKTTKANRRRRGNSVGKSKSSHKSSLSEEGTREGSSYEDDLGEDVPIEFNGYASEENSLGDNATDEIPIEIVEHPIKIEPVSEDEENVAEHKVKAEPADGEYSYKETSENLERPIKAEPTDSDGYEDEATENFEHRIKSEPQNNEDSGDTICEPPTKRSRKADLILGM